LRVKYDLSALAARNGIRRRTIALRSNPPPSMYAGDMFRAVYVPLIDLWTAAVPAIAGEYERTLSAMTADSASDIEGEIAAAEQRAALLAVSVSPKIRGWVSKVERWQRNQWTSAVRLATRVDLSTLLGPDDVRETVEAFLARNVALVKDVSAQARGRIADAVFRGLTERKPARVVAEEISEAVGMARKRALRIAADQNSKLASALADERRRDAGIQTWTWLHSEKAKPRLDHQARDGFLYSDDRADVGKKIEGKTVRPLPPERPGELPFCGCRSRALLVLP